MKFLSTIPFLASMVSAAAVSQAASPIDVQLELVGNTAIKASITNTGAEALKVLKTGSLLDESPVKKVSIFQGAEQVAFDGVELQILYSNLDEEAFLVLAAGETLSAEFDAAVFHDLSAGGAFDIVAEGTWALAASLNSTELTDYVTFSSNLLSEVQVDGVVAGAMHADFLGRRTAVQNDCSGSRRTAATNAISRCRSLAQTAQSQTSNTAKMQEYFKSSSTSTRNTVAGVFSRVASECGSTSSGVSRFYCTDVYGACSPGVIAYTLPSQSYMAYCNLFFNGMPATSGQCHAQDQQTTVLHEATHLRQIAGTDDYGGYGYNFVQSLSAAQNLNHADTYTLFAQSFYAGC